MKTPDLSLPRVAAPALLLIALTGCDQGSPSASSTAPANEVASTDDTGATTTAPTAAESKAATPGTATPGGNGTVNRQLTTSTAATATGPSNLGTKSPTKGKGRGNSNDFTIPAVTERGSVARHRST